MSVFSGIFADDCQHGLEGFHAIIWGTMIAFVRHNVAADAHKVDAVLFVPFQHAQ